MVDREATAEAYSRIAIPGPEECACLYCRNWIAGRAQVVPPGVRRLLEKCGVPLNGETEVWHVPGVSKPHGYGGWYTVVGELLKAPPADLDLGGWTVNFTGGPSYPVEAFAGQTVFEVSFFTETETFVPGDY
jgi:hypothetical protein